MYYEYIYCPECECEEVEVYDDGSCECQGCGYQWYLED